MATEAFMEMIQFHFNVVLFAKIFNGEIIGVENESVENPEERKRNLQKTK